MVEVHFLKDKSYKQLHIHFDENSTEEDIKQQLFYYNEYNFDGLSAWADSDKYLLDFKGVKFLHFRPIYDGKPFEYKYIYELEGLKYLDAERVTREAELILGYEEQKSILDFSLLKSKDTIEYTFLGMKDTELNPRALTNLKTLVVHDKQYRSVFDMFSSKALDTLEITECGIKNLDGIEQSEKLQVLELYYDRKLTDISKLSSVAKTLRCLTIEACNKIEDFSVLRKLKNLEVLSLEGNFELENLDFINDMTNLKIVRLLCNVKSGDLSPLLKLEYVFVKNRKNFNLKDKDFNKNYEYKSTYNEGIPLWRHLY